MIKNRRRKKMIGYQYKFILDKESAERLMVLAKEFGFEKTADFLEIVLKRFYPVMEKWHYQLDNYESQYAFVHPDKEMGRVDLVLDLPGYLYRRLKLMHQDLNLYSMAQIVREVIREFFWFYKLYGRRMWDVLKSQVGEWRKVKAGFRKSGRSVTQLYEDSQAEESEEVRIKLKTLYTPEFSPVKIYLC